MKELFIFAGILAALVAWPINTWTVKIGGEKTIAFLIPLGEEILKTGFAILFNTSILGSHLVFGLIEGWYDLINSSNYGRFAAIASVVSHLFFGLSTSGMYIITNNTSWGVFTAFIMHLLWNSYVMGILVKKQG